MSEEETKKDRVPAKGEYTFVIPPNTWVLDDGEEYNLFPVYGVYNREYLSWVDNGYIEARFEKSESEYIELWFCAMGTGMVAIKYDAYKLNPDNPYKITIAWDLLDKTSYTTGKNVALFIDDEEVGRAYFNKRNKAIAPPPRWPRSKTRKVWSTWAIVILVSMWLFNSCSKFCKEPYSHHHQHEVRGQYQIAESKYPEREEKR